MYLDNIRLRKNLQKAWRDLINNKAIENTCLLANNTTYFELSQTLT